MSYQFGNPSGTGYPSTYSTTYPPFQPPHEERGYTPEVRYIHSQKKGMFENCDGKIPCLIVGLALACITAVAAYFCFVQGFALYDTAFTSFELFGGGTLIYMGAAFTFAAVGNVLYSGCKVVCCGVMKDKEPLKYTSKEATMQIAITFFAPVAAIPAAVVGGCLLALGGGQ